MSTLTAATRAAHLTRGPFEPLVLTLSAWMMTICPTPEAYGQESSTNPQKEEIVITIVYDNNPGPPELKTGWGFACLIEGLEKTILFDTGGDDGILLQNMNALGLDPERVDAVVLSHIHGDHTGGLESFLRRRTGLPVYLPTGFPAAFKERMESLGAKPVEAEQSTVVCKGARTTGTLGQGAIEEQGLCIRTGEGWVLTTGCAHPGIAELAARAKRETEETIHLAIGGFHLARRADSSINGVIDRLERLGVEQAAPCHCSGDNARRLFQQRLKDRCRLVGVGSVLRFPTADQTPEQNRTKPATSKGQ